MREGKEGKKARFVKQDVADENFARDNYKYEAEKDVSLGTVWKSKNNASRSSTRSIRRGSSTETTITIYILCTQNLYRYRAR